MKTISFTIPSFTTSLLEKRKHIIHTISEKISSLTSWVYSFSDFSGQTSYTPLTGRSRLVNIKRRLGNNKKFLKYIPLGMLLFVVIVSVGLFLKSDTRGVMGVSDNGRVTISDPLAEKDVNASFAFPIRDDAGEEVGKITYTIEKASLRDEFVIGGQKATAIEGRSFFLISLKLKNDTQNTVSINTRDFVRMKLSGSDELFAPTIHNDPVEVQAISTLRTQLGFPITDDDKSFVLQVGEIDGDKKTVEVEF